MIQLIEKIEEEVKLHFSCEKGLINFVEFVDMPIVQCVRHIKVGFLLRKLKKHLPYISPFQCNHNDRTVFVTMVLFETPYTHGQKMMIQNKNIPSGVPFSTFSEKIAFQYKEDKNEKKLIRMKDGVNYSVCAHQYSYVG